MAAPIESAGTSSEKSGDEEELDLCSPKFNPLRALSSSKVRIPFENVKTFPSLESYEGAIKRRQQNRGRGESSLQHDVEIKSERTGASTSVEGQKSSNEPICSPGRSQPKDRNLQPQQQPKKEFSQKETQKPCTTAEQKSEQQQIPGTSKFQGGKRKVQRNVLTRMIAMGGPLKLLTRCVEEKLHVRVMTRAAVTVRGLCRGYIVAFDKHFNMAMIDVDEIFRRPPGAGKIRVRRSQKLREAHNILEGERKEQKAKYKENQEANINLWNKTSDILSNKSSTIQETLTKLSTEDLKGVLSSVREVKTKEKWDSNPKTSEENRMQHSTQSSASSQASRAATAVGGCQSFGVTKSRLGIHDKGDSVLSVFQKESLILGIPEENLECRHLNQFFIRGENVVLVSIIDE